MRYLAAIVAVSAFMGFGYNLGQATDTLGLTPEQTQEVIRNQRYYDELTLQVVKEKLRQDRERNQNPYIDCTLLGSVKGYDMEEAKSLARKMGANSIRWIKVTSNSASGQAYKCPER
jgi:hypothetical protein